MSGLFKTISAKLSGSLARQSRSSSKNVHNQNAKPAWLVIGLGNPGATYHRNWHNLGFLATDKLVATLDWANFQHKKSFQANLTTGQLNQQLIVIGQPQTFMNRSGQAVQAILRYYKISLDHLIIIHDDLDLSVGTTRLVRNSSAGGHNGVKSIINHIGSQDFLRFKLGITTEQTKRLGGQKYVLTNHQVNQQVIISHMIDKTTRAIIELIENSSPLERVMSWYNEKAS